MDRDEQLMMLEVEWHRRGQPWRCEYCGQPLHRRGEAPTGVGRLIGNRRFSTGLAHPVPEHVISRGPTTLENLVPACQTCNQFKGPKPVDVFMAELSEFKQQYREEWSKLTAIWDNVELQQRSEREVRARFEDALQQRGVKLVARGHEPVQFTKKQLSDLDRDHIRPNGGVLHHFSTSRRDWWYFVAIFRSHEGANKVRDYLTWWNNELRTKRPDTIIPFEIIE